MIEPTRMQLLGRGLGSTPHWPIWGWDEANEKASISGLRSTIEAQLVLPLYELY